MTKFKVKPETRGPAIEILIWPTFKALRATANRDDVKPYRKVLGYTVSYEKPIKGVIAQIHLCAKALSPEIVSHEVAHAIIGLAQWRGFHVELARDFENGKPASAGEERFCYALGRTVQSVVIELNERGYYDTPEK